MHFDLDDSGTIIFGDITFQPWPHYGRARDSQDGEHQPEYFVQQILVVDDLFCWAWRARIPVPIREAIVGFPDGHSDLLKLAQAAPDLFLRMSNDNPALLRLIASRDAVPRLIDPSNPALLLRTKHRDVLECLGWQRSRSVVRLLRKVPVPDCHLYLIRRLRSAASAPAVARVVRHLPKINDAVIHLLEMPEVLRDYQILYLAASDPSRAALRVSGMVSIVCNARRNLGRNPWPFNGMIRSWEGLIRLIYRTELLQHGASGPLPEPPIPPVHEAGPDGLQIAALDSVGLLQEEGLRMENCIFGYIEGILLGEVYAYRIVSPERATLLLSQDGRGKWEIGQAMLAANEREVSEETRKLLETWIQEARK